MLFSLQLICIVRGIALSINPFYVCVPVFKKINFISYVLCIVAGDHSAQHGGRRGRGRGLAGGDHGRVFQVRQRGACRHLPREAVGGGQRRSHRQDFRRVLCWSR